MSCNRSCPHHFHCDCDPLFAAAHKGRCSAHQGCNCIQHATTKPVQPPQTTELPSITTLIVIALILGLID